jgi:hypothetical protein
MTERPLETGWLPDTPVADNALRRFLFNQGELNAKLALAGGGRSHQTDAVALADSGGPVPYFNQALPLRPLRGLDDLVLASIDGFYEDMDRPVTLLSAWPTPDLRPLGWTLMGHPAFVVRSPLPADRAPAPAVDVRTVESLDDLRTFERIAVDGYPMDDLRHEPPGSLFPDGLLAPGTTPDDGAAPESTAGGWPVLRLGVLDGKPVGAAVAHTGHGVVNLCFAATLPESRRRGVWDALVRARLTDGPGLPAVAYTSDDSRPGFERMGFVPVLRFTLWFRG